MSFDTSKRKLRGIWEEQKTQKNNVDNLNLKQRKRKTQVTLAQPNIVDFTSGKPISSGWLPFIVKENDTDGNPSICGVTYLITMNVPENKIVYARLDMIYSGADLSGGNEIRSSQFTVIENTLISNIKKVTWNVGLTIIKGTGSLQDFLIKFNLTFVPGII